MATADTYPHIGLATDGKVVIEGTRYTVEHIAAEQYFYGWSAEEIPRQHPHLTLVQIYAALTYYHDRSQHFDSEIREQLRDVDLIGSRQEPSLLGEKLRKAGEPQ